MALLFMDSFDHYVTADILDKYASAPSVVISAGNGRRGTASLRAASAAQFVQASLNTADTTVVVGVAVKVNPLPTTLGNNIEIDGGGGAAQLVLVVNSLGALVAYRGNQTALLGASANGIISAGAFNYIELKAVIHPSAGSVTVRVNEATVLTLTGINTAQTGVAGYSAVRLTGSSGSNWDFDDFYLLDGTGAAPRNDFLGDCRVDVRLPTAQGNSHAWTPTPTVDNALNVDDPAPDDDTTYNATTTVGATDTLIVQDAPVPGATFFGLQLCLNQRKSDAGTCSIAPVVRHAGTDYPGTATNPGVIYGYAVVPYNTNPGTGAAWTESDFNAAEFGYKRTA